MRLRLFTTACVLLALTPAFARAQTFTPAITQTVGSGANESFLVVDFHDGTTDHSVAFGYLYDSPKTGLNMIAALAGAGLTVGYVPGYGPADHNAFGVAVNSFQYGSHTEAGFDLAGYWAYWLSGDGQNWGFAGSGPDGRTLVNGSWDGWSWDTGAGLSPVTPQAVPEPSALVVFGAGGLAAFGLLRRRRR